MASCNSNNEGNTKTDITKFVNTFIGTDGYGKTFPGAALPFSQLQVSPDNGWSDSYTYEKEQFIGFSHMHVVGMPEVQLPNLTVMPTIKKVVNDTTGNGRNFLQGFLSPFQHASEQASPGYYGVNLLQEDIFAEVTLKERAALHSFQFSKKDTATVLLDLAWNSNAFDNTDTYMFVEDDSSTVVGYRESGGTLPKRKIYFAAKFSEKVDRYHLIEGGKIDVSKREVTGKYVCGAFYFTNNNNEPILVKTAFSSINEEAALKNLNTEIETWDFEVIKNEAIEKWNNALGRISIKTNNLAVLTNFYSALYRTMLAPNVFSDKDNRFLNANGDVENGEQYHNISFKNASNAIFPLLNLILTSQTEKFINSALIFQQNNPDKTLPGFLHWSKDIKPEHSLFSASTISATWLKGIDSYNGLQALNSYDSSIFVKSPLYQLYNGREFIANNRTELALSHTLLNAYNEWSIAQLAKNFNDSTSFRYHLNRSKAYKSLFNKKIKLFSEKNGDGEFLIDIDTSKNTIPLFAEQFRAVHAIDTLIKYFGGVDAFEAKLDSLFEPVFSKKNNPDFLAKINHPKNEFFFHAAYLYNKIGKPEKTQELVRLLMENYFKPAPEGLPIADATGKISAWYVFSALGLQPVDPVSNTYEIGSPLISQALVQLPNDKVLDIRVLNQGLENIYVQSVTFNNQKVSGSQITYEQIIEGGELVFEMTNRKQLAMGQ